MVLLSLLSGSMEQDSVSATTEEERFWREYTDLKKVDLASEHEPLQIKVDQKSLPPSLFQKMMENPNYEYSFWTELLNETIASHSVKKPTERPSPFSIYMRVCEHMPPSNVARLRAINEICDKWTNKLASTPTENILARLTSFCTFLKDFCRAEGYGNFFWNSCTFAFYWRNLQSSDETVLKAILGQFQILLKDIVENMPHVVGDFFNMECRSSPNPELCISLHQLYSDFRASFVNSDPKVNVQLRKMQLECLLLIAIIAHYFQSNAQEHEPIDGGERFAETDDDEANVIGEEEASAYENVLSSLCPSNTE